MRDRTKDLGLMLLLLMSITGVAAGPSPAQTQIQAVLNEQMVAANAHDTDRFLASYLHSPELVFVLDGNTPQPITIHGWDALRAQQLKWWQNTDATYRARGTVEFTEVSKDVEVVTEPLSSHRTLPNGQANDRDFVITMACKKTPEGWRVVYAHETWMP